MNFKFYLPLLVAIAIAVGCNVDKSYDLSNIKTDDLSIGDDESVFNMPLATITLLSEDLDGYITSASSEDLTTRASALDNATLSDFIKIITVLLPSDSEFSVAELTADDNEAAVSELVDELFEELSTNDDKCWDLAEILYDYKDDFTGEDLVAIYDFLGVDKDGDITVDDIYSAIKKSLVDAELTEEFKVYISDIFTEYIVEDLKTYSEINVDSDLGTITIPSDIVDIIKDNIEDVNSTLSLIASYEHNFPFDLSLSSIDLVNGDKSLTIVFSEDGEEILNEVDIDLLTEILESGDGASMVLDINIESIMSGDAEDNYIKITLSLQKGGAIVLNL